MILRPAVELLEDRHDLTVTESGLLHRESPLHRLRKNSTSEHNRYFSGGLPLDQLLGHSITYRRGGPARGSQGVHAVDAALLQ